MKKHFLIGITLLTIFYVGNAFAQKEKPNFSGTWIYDESKSNQAIKKIFKSSNKTPDPKRRTIEKLVIEHSGNEIRLTETRLMETFDESGNLINKSESVSPAKIYYTDKRGEQNFNEKNQPIDSIAQWRNKEIMVVFLDKKKNRTIEMLVFSLSNKGQELTISYRSYERDNDVSFSSGQRISLSGFGNKVFNKIN